MATARSVAILVAALCFCCGCSAPSRSPGEPPKLLREESFTCATLAEAANHYIALGEEAGIKELEAHALDWDVDHQAGFSRNERIGWVCRIVFQSRGKEALRAPRYGGLSLPWNSMPLTEWPLYPVACSGSTYYVLSEGYTLAGWPEDPKRYLHYCQTEGKFRTECLPVPTSCQALEDLEGLRQSATWKTIKWSDSGQGFYYKFSEEDVWAFMLMQAEKCPNK